MNSEKKTYVYRLMKATCSCGAKVGMDFWNKNRPVFEQNLNAKHDHGVYFHDMESPLLNANDHIKDDNINTMGRCTSPWNPRGALLTVSLFAPLIPGAHLFSAALGMALRSQFGCICEPVTLVPWVYVDDDYLIDGAPALTIESELPCFWGGSIKIVVQREDADAADGSAENGEEASGGESEQAPPADVDARDLLPSEVQEKIDSFCDPEMSNATSRADEELANSTEEAQDTQERVNNALGNYVKTYSFSFNEDYGIDVTLPTLPSYEVRPGEPININPNPREGAYVLENRQ